ncbi:hypothetical protein [Haloarcula salinisoli]|uniref:DUF8048 domain-containing protein n=1 Tax=Haloarcula salinisoli TaxID=2487746 RepID=A0A8J7YCT0_9EURY|nr:hypothetical protein [Halomicroarcula salinisoli]MBX0303152.1 hypothetical protein [Halomicroarcula salinisoli]
MTDDELLAPFDLAVIRTTAQRNDVEEGVLRDALAAHQRTMRENPGVEDVVYEWRKQYDDPVLVRTPDVFILALPPTVWEEYANYLEFEDGVLPAVAAVHAEQTVRTDAVSASSLVSDRAPLLVARE